MRKREKKVKKKKKKEGGGGGGESKLEGKEGKRKDEKMKKEKRKKNTLNQQSASAPQRVSCPSPKRAFPSSTTSALKHYLKHARYPEGLPYSCSSR